jgi:hypothetical protein
LEWAKCYRPPCLLAFVGLVSLVRRKKGGFLPWLLPARRRTHKSTSANSWLFVMGRLLSVAKLFCRFGAVPLVSVWTAGLVSSVIGTETGFAPQIGPDEPRFFVVSYRRICRTLFTSVILYKIRDLATTRGPPQRRSPHSADGLPPTSNGVDCWGDLARHTDNRTGWSQRACRRGKPNGRQFPPCTYMDQLWSNAGTSVYFALATSHQPFKKTRTFQSELWAHTGDLGLDVRHALHHATPLRFIFWTERPNRGSTDVEPLGSHSSRSTAPDVFSGALESRQIRTS